MKCGACARGDHADCNLSPSCACDCDPDECEPFVDADDLDEIEDLEDEPYQIGVGFEEDY